MKLLQVKSEYKGMTISKTVAGFGTITFDAFVQQKYFNNYRQFFPDIFDLVDCCDVCKEETPCNCDKLENLEALKDIKPEKIEPLIDQFYKEKQSNLEIAVQETKDYINKKTRNHGKETR